MEDINWAKLFELRAKEQKDKKKYKERPNEDWLKHFNSFINSFQKQKM